MMADLRVGSRQTSTSTGQVGNEPVKVEFRLESPSKNSTEVTHSVSESTDRVVVLCCLLFILGLGSLNVLHVFAWSLTTASVSFAVFALLASAFNFCRRHTLAQIYSSTQSPSNVLPNHTAAPGSPQPKGACVELRLYTPPEIDQLLAEVGADTNDHLQAILDIPVTTKHDAHESPQNNISSERQSQLQGLQQAGGGPRDEGADGGGDLTVAAQTLCFLRNFLAMPHHMLGRSGPVCPYMPTSLRKNITYLAVVRTGPAVQASDVVAVVQPFAQRFGTLPPVAGALASFKAVVLVFPDIPLAEAPALIDGVQAALKPEFVQRGLMIGEFHMNNNASSLSNPEFYPLRTPVPTIAIRHMVTGDIAFLDLTKYTPEARVSFLSCYISRFEHDPNAKTAEMVARARVELARALAELAGPVDALAAGDFRS